MIQVFLEIDQLKLSIKREGAGLRLETFDAAVEAGVLGEEFVWEVEDETLDEDFDFTALDESVLGDNFEDTATPVGQAFREVDHQAAPAPAQYSWIRLVASTLSTNARPLLDPACEPIFH